jgi:formylglycine-generating enzyme required for sulfatase activity
MSDNHTYELPAGTWLHGRYRIEAVLGQGGFGITYKAVDEKLARKVCIKELFLSNHCIRTAGNTVQSQGLKDLKFSDFRDRFLEEARRLARFEHPGIVSVQDVFEENGTAYYAMKYIEGQSLQEHLKKQGRMGIAKALGVFYSLLDAGEVLHRADPPLLHRDIKPGNIMLRSDDSPVLIDFGSAREYREGVSVSQSEILTAGYAPLEQYQPKAKRGAFTDVYGLGATLYTMLSGKKPNAATDRVLEETATPRELNPAIPESLSAAIMKALALKPEDRFQSVGELREALKKVGQDPHATRLNKQVNPVANPPETKPDNPLTQELPKQKTSNQQTNPPGRQWLPLAAVLGLLLVSAGIWLNRKDNSSPQENTDSAPMTGVPADSIKRDSPTVVDTAHIPNPKPAPNNPNNPSTTKTETTGTEKLQSVLQKLQNNMVFVQGGTFTMGCPEEQGSECDSDENPAHQVTVSSFRMGKYEVTQAEWEAVMGSNPSYFTNCPNCPVEQVSWDDVQAFIGKLNTMTGGKYRLPTEAEWEYAARGGNRSSGAIYSGSNDIGSVAWYDGNAGNRTHPVGQKQTNALGLFDMTGNAWEWCSDWYGENYYSSSPSSNPKGPSTGAVRVLRGGGWNINAQLCRVSNRIGYPPGGGRNSFGFRLVSPSQ